MDSIPSDIYANDDKLPDTGSLGRFPDEIIQHLLRFVPPRDILQCFQLLCHRFYRLANEGLLWRYHCRSTFKYWHPGHGFGEKLQATVASVDWKYLFLLRTRSNHTISQLLDGIVETKVGRLKKIEKICRLGYDAKDFLLVQCHIHESASDVLARSNAILDNIHRSIALEEWSRLGLDRDSLSAQDAAQRLERALGAFDMFVLHDQTGDLDDAGTELSKSSKLFNSGIEQMGQALRHEEHESIPLISSAIFCCLAARLGLNAQCCALPSHVYAIVFAQSGYTLDGDVDCYREQPERMYLDPYGLDNEVPASDLHNLLAHYAWQTSTGAFLAPVPPITMVLRTAQNIKATFARILELQDDAHPELSQLLRGNDAMNVDAALYSAMWSSLMLTPPDTFEWNDRLASFLHRFAGSWPEDVWLVEKYLWPMYNSFTALRHGFARHVNRGLGDPWDHWRLARDQDDLIPPMSRRDLDGNQSVNFKIGQVFRHRRYAWIGVITGWPDQGTQHLPVATSRDTDDESDTAAPGEHPRVPVRLPNQFYFMCL
ncbi:F-box domain-containing protein [Metarhizium robertsii ARSEF 23]|uniref:F-box domain-containing protein n=1 Tax=Metarhizium robertsii (strain ARSEF 23 / ATCC MYA-3075) TaxID=655844 RepID=E9EJL1_METRA|nr:F-box domain-containing protein [Metarhizium robertsii ARSEF 23]EFZ03335.2 F-box domain-containing protein [Metarhizium robertsii ARSEF 23]